MPRTLLAIAAGGALGSVARYLLGTYIAARTSGFPWATLLINVTGSLLLGFLVRALAGDRSPAAVAALTVGFCGGYTTFSTFSYELLTLVERDGGWRAAIYAGASVTLSLAAAAIGAMLARGLRGPAV